MLPHGVGERDIPVTAHCEQRPSDGTVAASSSRFPRRGVLLVWTDVRPGPPARIDGTGPRFDPMPKPGGGIRWLTRLDPGRRRRVPAGRAPARRQDRARARARGVRRSGRGRPRGGRRPSLRGTRPSRMAKDAPRGSSARHRPARRSPWPTSAIATGRSRPRRSPRSWDRMRHTRSPSSATSTSAACAVFRSVRSPPRSWPTPSSARWIAPSGARAPGIVRWVDDVVLWGSRPDVRRALCALDDVTGRMGLSLHEGKTRRSVEHRRGSSRRARRAGLLYHRGAVRTLYRASRVVTLSHPTMGEWLLVDERHVQRVGTGDPPEADLTIELPGTTIVPGFIDSHVHLTATGRSLDERGRQGTDLEGAPARSRRGAIGHGHVPRPSGGVRRVGLGSAGPADGRRAGRADPAARRPHADGRAHLRGERGGAHRPRPRRRGRHRGGRGRAADRSAHQGGEPTCLGVGGVVVRPPAHRGVPAAGRRPRRLSRRDGRPRDVTRPRPTSRCSLGHRRRLPVDVSPVPASMSLPEAMERGFLAIGGDLPVDGSIGARTAAFAHPYEDGAEQGELYHDDDALAEFFHAGHNAGLQVGVHAIGDRAIEQVLETWERVYAALDSRERRHFRARRHRIEHFVLPSADQIERTAMLGLAVSVQPAFDRLWGQGGGMYEERLGPARAMAAHPIRTMLDRGIEVGVGSDSPVTPLDPMLAIAALERPPRAHAAAHEARGPEAPPSGERPPGTPGRQEGSARAGTPCGLRRVRRRSARRGLPGGPPPRPHGLPRPRGLPSLIGRASGCSWHCFSAFGLPSRSLAR